MAKKSATRPELSDVQYFLRDLRLLSEVPTQRKYSDLLLSEYPFDLQLLTLSPIYRESRKLYLALGGSFSQKVSSAMRSLSSHDLFKDEIEFSPVWSEMLWFRDHTEDVSDPEAELDALMRFNGISLFHEQNHRVLWRVLPPAPSEESAFRRYLNFAESLVVVLDLVLGDQIGRKLSPGFERMKVIYRDGGEDTWWKKPKEIYRQYLLAVVCATYHALELVHNDDILGAVDYVFPGQKKLNKEAVQRSLGISELFTRVTNPQWQDRHWKTARTKLKKLHAGSVETPLALPSDPLDLDEEFKIVDRVLNVYGV